MTTKRYTELRQRVLDAQSANAVTRGSFASGSVAEEINGIMFGLYAGRQSYNGAHAVYVLHYVDGRKVSKAAFLAQMAQLTPCS